jgi:hypothetical protein
MVEDSVFYAVLTIARFMEYPARVTRPLEPVADAELSNADHVPALSWYNRSLRLMRVVQPVCAPLNTLACVLYARIEMLQGRGMKGLEWLQRAFLLNQGEENASHGELEILDAMLPILAKTMIPLSSFGCTLSSRQRHLTRRKRSRNVLQKFGSTSNLLDVMIELYDLVYQAQKLCNSTQELSSPSEDRAAVIDQLLQWKAAVDQRIALYKTRETREFLARLLVIFHTQHIRLCAASASQKNAFYHFETEFATIVSEARIVFGNGTRIPHETAYDISIVSCLYFTAWTCQQRHIRAQAIDLLRSSAPRCDHLWTMPGVVGTLEDLIAHDSNTTIENDSISDGIEDYRGRQTWGSVPEAVVQCQIPDRKVLEIWQHGKP